MPVWRPPQETSRLTENQDHVKTHSRKNWAEITFICVCVLSRLCFFDIVDDVVDKSDDNEESDSENETDNEDAEKDQTEVRHITHVTLMCNN